MVTGYGETAGAALANHNDVDKITFTGSTEVGRLLVRASAGNLKKVSLELGGKSPNIVFADADLEAALKGVFMGIFFCQGEICSAGSRLFVEQSIYDEFVSRLGTMAQAVKLGHGLDPDTKMGPLVSKAQQERVLKYIGLGREAKASAIAGGKAPDGHLAKGYFVEPTVFRDVRARRFSARLFALCRSRIFRKPLKKETTLNLVWQPAFGRATFAKRTRPPRRWRLERCGSIAITLSTTRRRGAA